MSTDMGPEPDIDDNLLAAYAEGRLSGERRARVEARLARDPQARSIVAALARESEPASAERGPLPYAWLPWGLAAAAVLLIGLSIAHWSGGEPAPESLVAAARRLRDEAPNSLADLRPLEETELAAGAAPPLRGGIAVHRPRGVLLDGQPTVEWRAIPGAVEYEVAIVGPQGDRMRIRTSETSVPWPRESAPLDPGVELFAEVSSDGAFGHVEGRSAFSIAPSGARTAWWAAVEEVRRRAPQGLSDLLVAHLALRRGYLLEAERAARAHMAAHPEDAAGRAVLDHVERRLGIARE